MEIIFDIANHTVQTHIRDDDKKNDDDDDDNAIDTQQQHIKMLINLLMVNE